MSGSVVFYRFKAQKDPSTIHFEGTGISVWDLKKDILAENKLGKGADFDFAIYNADTNDEYSDDKAIIPRSTSVIARRLPPSKPGRGNAQYYMVSSSSAAPSAGSSSSAAGLNGAGRGSGAAAVRGHVSRRFDGKETSPVKSSSSNSQPVIATTASTGADEAARIAAMLATTSEQWKDTQEQMSTATPVFYGNRRPGMGGARPAHASLAPEKPVPPGYVCYRCGQPGACSSIGCVPGGWVLADLRNPISRVVLQVTGFRTALRTTSRSGRTSHASSGRPVSRRASCRLWKDLARTARTRRV